MNNDELYKEYTRQCHASVPTSVRQEIDGKPQEDWAVRGTIGSFKWWAYTAFYHPDLHKMNALKQSANSDFQQKLGLPGCLVGYSFMEAINEDEEIRNLLRKPVILNISAYLSGEDKEAMLKFEEVLYEAVGQQHDVFYFNQEHQQMAVRQPYIMDRDLVFPSYKASEVMLQNFAMMAPGLIAAGANTVSGLFVCRIKPTMDGRSSEIFPEDYRIPIIANPGGFW